MRYSEMSNYIFLDIDGVLNCKQTRARAPYNIQGIGKKHLNVLKTIADRTNGRIVLISDWRQSFLPDDHMPKMADYITKKLDSVGLSLEIVSENHCYESRVDEIAEWIRKHPTEGFIIIDDTYEEGYKTAAIQTHWVQTDYKRGLEEKHIEEAVEKMAVPIKQFYQ